jgi:sugar-specific transcriptional regulator TrmB
MNKKEVYHILTRVGLSPAETAVYVAMLEGTVSVAEIVSLTGEKRPTVYYVLNSLEKRGLLSKTGKEYGGKFQLEPLTALENLVEKNIREQTTLLEEAQRIKSVFKEKQKTEKTLVSYFDTDAAIKSAIFYSLYAKEKTVRTIVPGRHFFLDAGTAFITEYVAEKKKRKIKTIALWEDIPQKSVLEEYYKDSGIRQLPIEMHNSFETTIFMYDNKTLYIAPKKERHAILIQSDAHTAMMRTMFEAVWRTAFQIKN